MKYYYIDVRWHTDKTLVWENKQWLYIYNYKTDWTSLTLSAVAQTPD